LRSSDNHAVAALDPEDLKTHGKRLDLRDCDALVLSACVQMPSLSAIEEVERHSGLPTLSAAMANEVGDPARAQPRTVLPGAGEPSSFCARTYRLVPYSCAYAGTSPDVHPESGRTVRLPAGLVGSA
jgi:hypothetical protein